MTLSSGPVHGGLLSIFYLCDNVLSSPISMKMKITGDTNIQKKNDLYHAHHQRYLKQ